MKTAYIAIGLACALAVGVSGCNKDREAKATTGTASATIKTDAPAFGSSARPACRPRRSKPPRRPASRLTAPVP